MPTVDTTYIIGVIREWEKGFLEDDEYTRIIEATSATEATQGLSDTPYGQFLTKKGSGQAVIEALGSHLKQVHEYLKDTLADERVWQFISARYDALNVASVLIEAQVGNKSPGLLSPLGSIEHDVLQSTVWHNAGWELMPETWEEFIRDHLTGKINKVKLLKQVSRRQKQWMETLAFTPLMCDVVEWWNKKEKTDDKRRPLGEQLGAIEYNREQDESLLEIVKRYRLGVMGWDPIIAFWYAKELEVKNLRILMAAKLAGLEADKVRDFRRSLYREL